MQLRGEPDLGVDDAVGGQVLGAFGGDPGQRLGRLHDRHRVPERLQVQLKVTAPRGAGHRLGQFIRVGGRQAVVPDGLGQLHDGRGTEAAVQVIVQQHLRDGADLIKAQGHGLIVNHPGRRAQDGAGAGGRRTGAGPAGRVGGPGRGQPSRRAASRWARSSAAPVISTTLSRLARPVMRTTSRRGTRNAPPPRAGPPRWPCPRRPGRSPPRPARPRNARPRRRGTPPASPGA